MELGRSNTIREAALLPYGIERTNEEAGGIYLSGQFYLYLGNPCTQVWVLFLYRFM